MHPIRTAGPLAPVLALGLALAACSATEYETDAPAGAPATGAPAAALPVDPYAENVSRPAPPATTTARLVASPAFDFASARDVPFALDVPEARGTDTSLNLCTDWQLREGAASTGYDVDYGSCVLRTTMVDGYHEGTLALANQHDSVLAVVWFDDPARGPVYRELRLEVR